MRQRKPQGCAMMRDDALARCKAELYGKACQLCRRKVEAEPRDWDGGPGWNFVLTPTVQAVKVTRGQGPWVTVTFIAGRWVHGGFPPIVCATKRRALQLAHDRARQLVPAAQTERWFDDQWQRGRVTITVAQNNAPRRRGRRR